MRKARTKTGTTPKGGKYTSTRMESGMKSTRIKYGDFDHLHKTTMPKRKK
jgi:hypothetical protein